MKILLAYYFSLPFDKMIYCQIRICILAVLIFVKRISYRFSAYTVFVEGCHTTMIASLTLETKGWSCGPTVSGIEVVPHR